MSLKRLEWLSFCDTVDLFAGRSERYTEGLVVRIIRALHPTQF
jgi:hypothetical protein